MAWHFPQSGTTLVNLVGQDDAFVAQQVFLNAQIRGIGTAGHEVIVVGTVAGEGYAINLGTGAAGANSLTVEATGQVRMFGDASGSAIWMNGQGQQVVNHGLITSSHAGIYLYSSDPAATTSSSLVNTGTIDGVSYGVFRESASETLTVNNSGTIKGGNYSFTSAGVATKDEITNSGEMIGDILLGGGDDLYDGRLGTVEGDVYGEVGNDRLYAGAGNDALFGGLGNDMLRGDAGIDTLEGEDGNDHLWGGTGVDSHFGGAGIDFARYDDANHGNLTIRLDLPNLNTGAAAGDTYDGIEGLVGGVGNDIMVGNTFANTLIGGLGNDTLHGLAGNDTLHGLAGNDMLQGYEGNDLLLGGVGADVLNGGNGVDTASYGFAAAGLAARLDNPGLNTGDAAGDSYIAIEGLIGSTFNDILVGNASANTLIGGLGNDTLHGVAGNDILHGQDGNDVLLGGVGTDVLNGGNGIDSASYGLAAVGLTARLDNPALNAGDAIGDSYVAIENLAGSAFNDVLVGNAAANSISGGAGNDIINGLQGNDTLIGGAGNDVLAGSVGIDTFLFNAALNATTNVDKINDFSVADDTMRLENAIFTALTATGALAAAAFRANATGTAADADDRIIYETDTGKLFYDVNGNVAGGAIQFATLGVSLGLTNADFFVV